MGTALQCVLLVVYGCRLAGYLIYRDVKTAYNRRMKGEVKSDEGVSVVAKVGIWVSASLLYVLQTSPSCSAWKATAVPMSSALLAC